MLESRVIYELKKLNKAMEFSTKYSRVINIYSDWDINESRKISEGCTSIKISGSDKSVRFLITMEKDSSLPEHWHDESEIVKVISGEIINSATNKKYKSNQTVILEPFELHEFKNINNGYSYITIEFLLNGNDNDNIYK